uniref:C2H2-type domain-containing protein n=1 Tax=Syphacia muris TaxID=451379 RepID=A0A0N5AYQ5_9BILA
MEVSSSTSDSDVIVLSDSDEDTNQDASLPTAGVSIMISDERPLDLGLFIPSTSGCEFINDSVTDRSLLKNKTFDMSVKDANASVGKSHSIRSMELEGDLNNSICDCFEPNAPPLSATYINNNFKCGVEGCSAILSNNISLMFHLWSHLVNLQPYGLKSSISELEKIRMCPQCLTVFPTCNQLQNHYIDVHEKSFSSSTCLTCEIVKDKKHHLIHAGLDAPYFCGKCRYRTSVRALFLDHFIQVHFNTATLLCPFCLLTMNVRNIRKENFLLCQQYTDHIFSHLKVPQFKCDKCALKFLTEDERLAHKKDHIKLNIRWNKKFYTKISRRKGIRLLPQDEGSYCLECFKRVSNVTQHFKRKYVCTDCKYTTNCRNSFLHHSLVGCSRQRRGITRKRVMEGCFLATNFLHNSKSNELVLKNKDVFNNYLKNEKTVSQEANECEIQKEEEEEAYHDQFPKLLEKPCNDSSILVYAKRQFV